VFEEISLPGPPSFCNDSSLPPSFSNNNEVTAVTTHQANQSQFIWTSILLKSLYCIEVQDRELVAGATCICKQLLLDLKNM